MRDTYVWITRSYIYHAYGLEPWHGVLSYVWLVFDDDGVTDDGSTIPGSVSLLPPTPHGPSKVSRLLG
jgi:hypothetical protein